MSALRLPGRYSVKEVLILVAYEECNVDGVDAMQPAVWFHARAHTHTHTHILPAFRPHYPCLRAVLTGREPASSVYEPLHSTLYHAAVLGWRRDAVTAVYMTAMHGHCRPALWPSRASRLGWPNPHTTARVTVCHLVVVLHRMIDRALSLAITGCCRMANCGGDGSKTLSGGDTDAFRGPIQG